MSEPMKDMDRADGFGGQPMVGRIEDDALHDLFGAKR